MQGFSVSTAIARSTRTHFFLSNFAPSCSSEPICRDGLASSPLMQNAPDLLAFRTSRTTILIGPLAAFGRSGSELLLNGQAAIAQALDLLFGSRGETHLIRQFCVRWGL